MGWSTGPHAGTSAGPQGEPVRITESDLEAFIESARVEPMRVANVRSSVRGIA
jgi:hypothetical protein